MRGMLQINYDMNSDYFGLFMTKSVMA